jgi:hypothetical protein
MNQPQWKNTDMPGSDLTMIRETEREIEREREKRERKEREREEREKREREKRE